MPSARICFERLGRRVRAVRPENAPGREGAEDFLRKSIDARRSGDLGDDDLRLGFTPLGVEALDRRTASLPPVIHPSKQIPGPLVRPPASARRGREREGEEAGSSPSTRRRASRRARRTRAPRRFPRDAARRRACGGRSRLPEGASSDPAAPERRRRILPLTRRVRSRAASMSRAAPRARRRSARARPREEEEEEEEEDFLEGEERTVQGRRSSRLPDTRGRRATGRGPRASASGSPLHLLRILGRRQAPDIRLSEN